MLGFSTFAESVVAGNETFLVPIPANVTLSAVSTQASLTALDGFTLSARPVPSSASASAVGSTICLEITAKALRDLLEKEDGIAAPVLQALLLQMYMQNELRSKN